MTLPLCAQPGHRVRDQLYGSVDVGNNGHESPILFETKRHANLAHAVHRVLVLQHELPHFLCEPVITVLCHDQFLLSKSAPVVLTIYNLLGREITKLIDENQSVGEYAVQWHGRDYDGKQVSSGVYVYRLNAGSFHQTRKMLLLR